MTETHLREILARLNVEAGDTNASGWVVCQCPFAEFLHDRGRDSRPSFFAHVDPSGVSGYNCYTCKQTGTMVKLVSKLASLRGESYTELAVDAACYDTPDEWGDYEEGRSFEPAAPIEDGDVLIEAYPPAWEERDARLYLVERGIGEATAEKLNLRFDPEARRVVFPVMDYRGRVYGMTGRSIIPNAHVKVKDYMGLKKDQLLLGEQLRGDLRKCLVVEGLFALAHMVEIGALDLGVVPIATMGSHMSDFQADSIIDLFDSAALLYDDDLAGDIGLFGRQDEHGEHEGGGAVDLLSPHMATKVLNYPSRTGDPDEITSKELQKMLAE